MDHIKNLFNLYSNFNDFSNVEKIQDIIIHFQRSLSLVDLNNSHDHLKQIKVCILNFLTWCKLNNIDKMDFKNYPSYIDLWAAILSYYIDITVILNRYRMNVKKSADLLCTQVMLTLSPSLDYTFDALLQTAHIQVEDMDMIYPLLMKSFQCVAVKSYKTYTKYLCAIYQFNKLWPKDLKLFYNKFSRLEPPDGFLRWLKLKDHSVYKYLLPFKNSLTKSILNSEQILIDKFLQILVDDKEIPNLTNIEIFDFQAIENGQNYMIDLKGEDDMHKLMRAQSIKETLSTNCMDNDIKTKSIVINSLASDQKLDSLMDADLSFDCNFEDSHISKSKHDNVYLDEIKEYSNVIDTNEVIDNCLGEEKLMDLSVPEGILNYELELTPCKVKNLLGTNSVDSVEYDSDTSCNLIIDESINKMSDGNEFKNQFISRDKKFDDEVSNVNQTKLIEFSNLNVDDIDLRCEAEDSAQYINRNGDVNEIIKTSEQVETLENIIDQDSDHSMHSDKNVEIFENFNNVEITDVYESSKYFIKSLLDEIINDILINRSTIATKKNDSFIDSLINKHIDNNLLIHDEPNEGKILDEEAKDSLNMESKTFYFHLENMINIVPIEEDTNEQIDLTILKDRRRLDSPINFHRTTNETMNQNKEAEPSKIKIFHCPDDNGPPLEVNLTPARTLSRSKILFNSERKVVLNKENSIVNAKFEAYHGPLFRKTKSLMNENCDGSVNDGANFLRVKKCESFNLFRGDNITEIDNKSNSIYCDASIKSHLKPVANTGTKVSTEVEIRENVNDIPAICLDNGSLNVTKNIKLINNFEKYVIQSNIDRNNLINPEEAEVDIDNLRTPQLQINTLIKPIVDSNNCFQEVNNEDIQSITDCNSEPNNSIRIEHTNNCVKHSDESCRSVSLSFLNHFDTAPSKSEQNCRDVDGDDVDSFQEFIDDTSLSSQLTAIRKRLISDSALLTPLNPNVSKCRNESVSYLLTDNPDEFVSEPKKRKGHFENSSHLSADSNRWMRSSPIKSSPPLLRRSPRIMAQKKIN